MENLLLWMIKEYRTVSVLVWWWAFVNVAEKLKVSLPQTVQKHCTVVHQLLRDED